MPLELELEREAHRQQALRQIGADARIPRTSVGQMRASDLEADILSLPDLPISAAPIQIFDTASPFFGKKRYIFGVTLFTDTDSVII